ncbi:uncharacterized protein PFL1_03069 [Pseudozyma flocculosa PF-1]|uniref:RPEL repeat protein n=1 Tax=Pseudozyma flocculosa PF-1 TaxID=1277687 RepID=A0A061HA19_9BASI|nr:uncharacterized protein PFL1_03069 [Pseudozyma flocculosa PF-1]EPQ29314.1 hypothetical protein PFL1_03069 [Pseudozyma flocculosa PF-1]
MSGDAPLSPTASEAKELLEQRLAHRPAAAELEQQNILRNHGLAPSLQAARDELAKHQLEGKVENFLEKRPERDELLKKGILKNDGDGKIAPALQAKREELERSRLGDKLEKDIAARPDADKLRAQGILVDESS